jgi:8-oxo-dGTP diphosphatase
MAHRHGPARFCSSCAAELTPPGGPLPQACTACGRVRYDNPAVGVGVVARDAGGRLLLVRRGVEPGRGLWALPAGYVDAGEDPRVAAARETLEETGLEVRVGAVLDVYPTGIGGGGGASFFLAFAAEVVGGSLAAGDDALDAAFFAADSLPELAFASTADAAQRRA